jgi:hypothetical protein
MVRQDFNLPSRHGQEDARFRGHDDVVSLARLNRHSASMSSFAMRRIAGSAAFRRPCSTSAWNQDSCDRLFAASHLESRKLTPNPAPPPALLAAG